MSSGRPMVVVPENMVVQDSDWPLLKKYTELLGGSIEVESKRGKGSKFMLSLPLQYIAIQENIENYVDQLKTTKSVNNGEINTTGKTILLVEDNEAIVVQMKDILLQEGYHIMVAHNGNEALKQIEQQIPDAMILDLMMPEVDGFEVLKRIRNEEKTDHLPVIILTAKYVNETGACIPKKQWNSPAYSERGYQ